MCVPDLYRAQHYPAFQHWSAVPWSMWSWGGKAVMEVRECLFPYQWAVLQWHWHWKVGPHIQLVASSISSSSDNEFPLAVGFGKQGLERGGMRWILKIFRPFPVWQSCDHGGLFVPEVMYQMLPQYWVMCQPLFLPLLGLEKEERGKVEDSDSSTLLLYPPFPCPIQGVWGGGERAVEMIEQTVVSVVDFPHPPLASWMVWLWQRE